MIRFGREWARGPKIDSRSSELSQAGHLVEQYIVPGMSPEMARNGPHEMSDLSPECAPKRMSATTLGSRPKFEGKAENICSY